MSRSLDTGRIPIQFGRIIAVYGVNPATAGTELAFMPNCLSLAQNLRSGRVAANRNEVVNSRHALRLPGRIEFS